MRCYMCGTEVGNTSVCPLCGANLAIVGRIVSISNHLYNQGLSQAHARDLTGAVESLTLALHYNKRNTQARNLLGLIYMEIGEVYRAFSEWNVSLELDPVDNPARRLLSSRQRNPGQVEEMNQGIRKYNQALVYCRQKDYDLAEIQLKNVLEINPQLVSGYLLMALLKMQKGTYRDAEDMLARAKAIDHGNRLADHYSDMSRKLRNTVKEERVSAKDRMRRFRERSVLPGVVNFVIGLAAGAAIVGFLVVPGLRQSYKNNDSAELIEANEAVSGKEQTIKSLESEIETMQKEVEEAKQAKEDAADSITSYDNLLLAYDAYKDDQYTKASQYMEDVKRDLLSDEAKDLYDTVMDKVEEKLIAEHYSTGMRAYYAKSYKEAIEAYTEVVKMDEGYKSYRAAYLLAECYEKSGDEKNAKKWYNVVIDKGSGSTKSQAENRLEAMEEGENADADSSESSDSSDNGQ